MKKVKLQEKIEKASQLREKKRLKESFELLNKVILLAGLAQQPKVIIAALSERALVFKHYFELTGNQLWLDLMQKDVEAMQELGDKYKINDYKHTGYFRMGEVFRHGRDFKQAAKWYSLALKSFKGSLAQKGDWRYHLGAALYFSGQKEKGMKEFFRGLDEIKRGKNKIESFLYHVWLSGAFMQLAEMLSSEHKKIARGYKQMAKEIIESDKRLILRKKQLSRFKL